MRFLCKTILAAFLVLPFLVGCDKETPRQDAESTSAPAWPKPFSPTAPPPLAAGPSAGPGLAPTRHADARVGEKALYRVTPERSGPSRQTIEIVRTDSATAYAHQIVETKKFGRFVQYLSYNRFLEAPPTVDRFNPTNQERYLGDRIVAVGTKQLLCHVYEAQKGSSIYHTLLCDDVPGQLVQHSDNAAGVWKTRLQLLGVWD